MSQAYNGGCACGAIRYEITGEPVFMNCLLYTSDAADE